MICIYAPKDTDYSTNGLGILRPTVCDIMETAAGGYELVLTHPITEDLRWKLIADGCVIKAPVPAMETPNIRLVKDGIPGVPATPETPEIPAVPGQPGRVVWRVNITTQGSGGVSRVYEKPTTNSRVLDKMRNGMEYEYLGTHSGSWHKVVSPKGIYGFMYTANSVYVRTEPEIGGIPAVPARPGTPAIPEVPGYSTVVGPRQIRDQRFRIYKTAVDTEQQTITAYARHVSYSLMSNLTGNLRLDRAPLPIALSGLKACLLDPDDRQLICNVADEISGEWPYENGVKVLLDPETGFAVQAKCQVVRDNEDFFLLKNTAPDRRVTLRHGKNIKGVNWEINSDALATRIVPIGQDENGNPIILPEKWIDSPYIDNYPEHRLRRLPVSEAKVSKDMSLEQAYEAMRAAARKELELGCDLASFDLSVDFVQLGDTEEYRQYKNLQQVFLYDTISIIYGPMNLTARAQVKDYTWDAVLMRYKTMSVGNVFELSGPTIASYELPSWGVSGNKIAPGGVGTGQLRDMSVISAKIGHAVIDSEHVKLSVIEKGHLKEALINDLKADSIEAVKAHIQQLIADKVEADELYAKLAEFVVANMTTANMINANIEWADIENLKSAMITAFRARIEHLIANELITDELYAALAHIATAQIGTAEIAWAKIKDLVSGRQIFEQGVGGKLYIADLAVTEANMVSLTVGELIVRGADGRFYAVGVDEEGNVTTELKQIADGDIEDEGITGSTKIIEGSVTADRLNATDIFADNAIIRQLMAANLDVDTFFAREGVVNKITLDYVKPLNDAITVLGGNLSETNESIDQIISANATKQSVIDGQIANLSLALISLQAGVGENSTSTQGAIDSIRAMIASLEAQKTSISGKVAALEQAKLKTDNYIQIGTVKLSNGTTVFGVAVGKDVNVLNPDGTISTFERSMTATTANEFMILTGGAVVGVFDATGMTSESVKVNSIIMGGRFAWSMTPSKMMVLKKGD